MIKVTLFDSQEIVLNAELIESVEGTPDTVISLTNGKKVMVKETVDQVVDSIVAYKQLLGCTPERRQARAEGDVTFLRVEEQ